MKITLLTIGKTEDKYLREGIEKYLKRLEHYIPFKIVELSELKNTKNLSEDLQKNKEAELILKQITSADHIVLLDEKGGEFSSIQFADFLNKRMLSNVQHLVFVVGGPYGFDSSMYDRANGKISLFKNDIFAPDGKTVFCGAIVSCVHYFESRAISSQIRKTLN